MKLFKKITIACGALVFLTATLTACHTVQGAGEDIQSGGAAIERAAS